MTHPRGAASHSSLVTRARCYVLTLTIVAMACRSSSPDGEPPAVSVAPVASSSPQPAGTCSQRVAVMQKRLEAASARPAELGVDKGITVPRVDRVIGDEVPAAPIIAVSAESVLVDGQPEEDVVPLLERKRELWKSFNPDKRRETWELVVTADAALPLARLAALIEAVRKAGWTPLLMVQIPDYPRVPRNPPPWVKELFTSLKKDDLEPSAKASKIADAIARAARPCPSLAPAFAAVSSKSVDPAEKGKILAAELPKGVAACDCKLDVDALESLLVETLAGHDARYRVVPLTEPLTGATVRDLVPR